MFMTYILRLSEWSAFLMWIPCHHQYHYYSYQPAWAANVQQWRYESASPHGQRMSSSEDTNQPDRMGSECPAVKIRISQSSRICAHHKHKATWRMKHIITTFIHVNTTSIRSPDLSVQGCEAFWIPPINNMSMCTHLISMPFVLVATWYDYSWWWFPSLIQFTLGSLT